MISNYIKYCNQIAGYSMTTCEGYERDLRSFSVWAKAHIENARWSTLTQQDIEDYLSWLVAQGYEPATTNRALSAIKSLYRYLMRTGKIDASPAKKVLPRKQEQTIPTTISTEDLKAIFDAANDETKLIIILLYSTGIRIAELLSIRWQDVDFNTDSILIHGKGNRQRYVYMSKGLSERLAKRLSGHAWGGLVFEHGQRTVRHMLSEAAWLAGVHKPFSPHVLRHSIATEWAKGGANNAIIAKALGHKRIETSNKYISLAQLSTRQLMTDCKIY